MPVSPDTCTGVDRFVVVPSPSSPKLLDPHAQTVPSLLRATVWSPPAETAMTPVSPDTCTGVKVPDPHLQTVPSLLRATVWLDPAETEIMLAVLVVIVYVPLDTDEVVHPDRYATARIVEDEETDIGPEYTVPTVSVGTDPSAVYRIVAPEVVVDSVTFCADV